MSDSGKPSPSASIPWKEIFGALATIAVAYFGYLGIRSQIDIPIHATETAEAKVAPPTATLITTASSTVTQIPPPPTVTVSGVSEATLTASPPPQPRIYDFATCLTPCTGFNALTTFPAKTTIIYLTWKYENIPQNALYVRDYAQEKEGGGGWLSWITYQCTWTKPPSGSYDVSLYDGTGLASGNWRITISVNGVVLLQKSIFFQGHWKNWNPQGVFQSCE